MYEIQPRRGSAGETQQARGTIFGNRLLDTLPRDEVARLTPHLRRIFLHRGQEIALPGEALDDLIFPVDALVWSWIDTTKTERPSTVLAVGKRGAIGAEVLLEVPTQDANVVSLSPGNAWALSIAVALEPEGARTPLRRTLSRFVYGSLLACSARLACNSEHNVDKRLARWLLWIADETGKPEVTLTHQQIADVAAIRRPSVSLAFSDLQRRGIVRVHHGLVQILDRERLEREACYCYYAISEIANR